MARDVPVDGMSRLVALEDPLQALVGGASGPVVAGVQVGPDQDCSQSERVVLGEQVGSECRQGDVPLDGFEVGCGVGGDEVADERGVAGCAEGRGAVEGVEAAVCEVVPVSHVVQERSGL